jgi:CelD/BcsL family acetyltransferase involved in cellulose biosynthesis
VCESQGIRPDDTHTVSVHIAQTLPETLQAGERSCRDFFVDPAVLFDSGGQANHLAEPINDHELTVRIPRHDHVKAVRAEIDGR